MSFQRYEAIATDLFLCLITNDNPEVRQHLINRIATSPDVTYYLDDLVIIETVRALESAYKYKRKQITACLLPLLESGAFETDLDFFKTVFKEYQAHPSLSFPDCYIAINTAAKGVHPLWTANPKLPSLLKTPKLLL